MALCKATKADGTPCLSQARAGRLYCIAHDDQPDSQAARQAAAYRGGKASRPPIKTLEIDPPTTPQEAANALALIASRVLSGQLDSRAGQVASGALRAQLEALRLAERLDTAEREIARLRKRLGVESE